MTFVAIDVEHIVIQLYHRVIVPVFLKAVGAHVEPFGKWLGKVTNDATVDGVTKLDESGMLSVSQETPRSFAASS